MGKKKIVAAVFIGVAGLAAWLLLHCGSATDEGGAADAGAESSALRSTASGKPVSGLAKAIGSRTAAKKEAGEGLAEDVAATASKGAAGEVDVDDRLANEFYDETDRWISPEKGRARPPTMRDVDEFVAKFRRVPKSRKVECLQRALNLVPDENVMLLVGILMDKSEDRAIVELVYSDLLNRDESVKKPILQEIFKDKTHPCWVDTAWILDVTGETPGRN